MNEWLEGDETPKEKPRKIWIAALLSILAFPLGQLYNGQPKKALVLFLMITFTTIIFRLTRWITFFEGAVVFTFLALSILLYGIIDAIIWAKKQKNFIPQSYNNWSYYILVGLVFGVVNVFFGGWEGLEAKNFSIPTLSNQPTILEGDRILADMAAYQNQDPKRGDIVIYLIYDEKLEEDIHYIFRVVALPNDEVSVKENIVYINGQKSKTEFLETRIIENEFNYNGKDTIEYLKETFLNNQEHIIARKLNPPEYSQTATMEALRVPENSYFVMGDNRDFASDSRFKGSVNRDRIVGKASFVYWRNGEIVNIRIE